MLGKIRFCTIGFAMLCFALFGQSPVFAKSETISFEETESLAFFYRSVLPNQQHILNWVGNEQPKLGAQITVKLDDKKVGTLKIIKKTKTTVLCKYKGEEIALSKLKQYKLTYLGIPNVLVNGTQKSVFAPDEDLDKERLPQIALGTQATFAHNDALDVAFNTALNREQNSLDAFILLAPPAKAPVEWFNWFWLAATYSFNVQSNSRVVLGEQEKNSYFLSDKPKLFTASAGFRVPSTISLLAALEVYGIFHFETHEIKLESRILDTTDKITVEFQKTLMGGAYTIRLIDNLFLQLLYNHSLDGKVKVSSNEKLLETAGGSIETQEFGVKPYIYYELWDKTPQLDLKFEVGMIQAANVYKMRPESDENSNVQERTTRLEQLRVQPSIRIGLQF